MIEITVSAKQIGKISPFWNVKQINGEKAYKTLCQSHKALFCGERIKESIAQIQKKFIYVKEGEILVYKVDRNSTQQKSLIKSYRAGQFCGFQDYPLFWNETIKFEVEAKTILIVLPLKSFYRIFRRVIPLNYIMSKAQFLKKISVFKGVELEKIIQIACVSPKYRVQVGQTIAKDHEEITYVIVLCSGKYRLTNRLITEPIFCYRNEILFAKQILQGIDCSLFNIECECEGDIIVIPKVDFLRVSDLTYKFKSEQSQREINEYSRIRDHEDYSQKQRKGQTIHTEMNVFDKDEESQKSFAHTHYSGWKSKNKVWFKYGGESSTNPHKRALSRGQIQLQKFIRRKQKIQNNSFMKYVESRAPDIIVNPSKEFAIVKPFYKSKSIYVKNIKRKMKKSADYSKKSEKFFTTSFQLQP